MRQQQYQHRHLEGVRAVVSESAGDGFGLAAGKAIGDGVFTSSPKCRAALIQSVLESNDPGASNGGQTLNSEHLEQISSLLK